MPKISEQIAVHLSKDQLLDVIKDEVNHLREELDCGINDGVGEWQESQAGKRLACGCGGGCCLFARAPSSALGNDIYSPQPHRPTGPGHKHVPKYP